MSENPHTRPDTNSGIGGDFLRTARPPVSVRPAELSTSRVLAGGMAAATSALLGSYFGAFGTVGGAAVGSVVTTVGTSLYQRSLERARDRVARQIPLPNAFAFRGTPTISANETTLTTGPDGRPTVAEPGKVGPAVEAPFRMGRWIGMSLAGTVLFFGVGLGLVTGIEWVTGSPLSGGAGGTSLGEMLAPPPAPVSPNPSLPAEPQRVVPETSDTVPSPERSRSSGAQHSGKSSKKHSASKGGATQPPVPIIPTSPAPLPLPRIGLLGS
jgi:hypothetical protein